MDVISLRRRLHENHVVFGTMLTAMTSPRLISALRVLALDLLVIDREHAAISSSEMGDAIAATELAGMVPLVRLPAPDPGAARRAMDAGAAGVLVPYCETVDDIAAVVAAVRLRPIRGKRLAEVASPEPLAVALRSPRADRQSLVIVGIESVPALDQLDALLEAPGIDAVFIGAQDLAASLGHLAIDDARVTAAFARVLRACRARQLPAALFTVDTATQRRWIRRGVRIVLHMSDIVGLVHGLAQPFGALRGEAQRLRARASADRNKRSRKS